MKQKLWAILPLFFALVLFFPISAKAKELTLTDQGNGFYLPDTFELKGADGSFLTAPLIDPSLFAAGVEQEPEELTLENGMRAEKWWVKVEGEDELAFPCISVYDVAGNEIYRAGRDGCGDLSVYLRDADGNTLLSRYTRYEVKYEDGQQKGTSLDLSEPWDMEQFDASKNVTHYESYTRSYDKETGEEYSPLINSYDTYWDEDGAVKNQQLVINGEAVSTWDEANTIVFDDFEYTVKEPVAMSKQEWKMLEPCFTEGDHHICPAYTTALAGQPVVGIKVVMVNDAGEEKESVMYFTETHLDIMEDENVLIRRHVEYGDGTEGTEPVVYYDVIKKQCPLYLYDEMFANTTLIECRSPKAEEMFQKQQELEQKKKDAIIRGSTRAAAMDTEAGEAAEGSTYSERDGEPVWTQRIVGDVVPINGMVPEVLETWEHDGHVLLTLRDAAGNIVNSADNGSDKSHTEYQYVYFTMLSLLDNGMVIFQVAGTNQEGMGGNLNGINNSQYETDQGTTGGTDYYNDYSTGDEFYDPAGGDPYAYEEPYDYSDEEGGYE